MTEVLPARRLVEEAIRASCTETARTADRLADELMCRIAMDEPRDGDEEATQGSGYHRLLREALAAAAEARGALAARTREIERLRNLSITDETTGVLNRRGFDHALERAIARLQRTGESGLLLVIDLNGFKAINDQYGHRAGDLTLTAVATLLSRQTRATDAVARLGGDEFAVILGGADPIDGRIKASRLEAHLNALTVPWQGERIAVSASVGVVDYADGDEAIDVVHRADLDMYRQKRLVAAGTVQQANEGETQGPHSPMIVLPGH
ncbi:GGDEF domain-containing protein [Marivibrio halodurans]|uniref:diguanylate cyclase n=1 Tax=Marivibrio halodurans TaxID=2039722 RepID=A0A8J7SLB8_9PROT|nr:GGDEF domain-containing protein [Marivibrio halodurans]MBP5856116.1 GGDEF domain-containing protein [Marivibrio halodurans]